MIDFVDSADVDYAIMNNKDPQENVEEVKKDMIPVKRGEKKADKEEAFCELDKYFKKTKAKPVLYYLPLTEEEANAKGKAK